MRFPDFKVGNIIKLRKGMGTFPASDVFQEAKLINTTPFYLSMDLNKHVREAEVLLILEVIRKNNSETYPFAYTCLKENKIIYIYDLRNEGINSHVCFETCNKV